MPRKAYNDYIFYKITCISDDIDLCYVGSTANWKARNHQHKSDCNNANCKNYNTKIYKTIRENGGWCNFKMIEIGKKEQLTKREAEAIEEEYRVELKANMNSQRCYLTEEQKQNYYEEYKDTYKNYYEENKDKYKNYYEKNKDKILEQHYKWIENNKDKVKNSNKNYRNNNIDKVKIIQSDWYKNNKEYINCDCGCKIIKQNLNNHILTTKHIKLVNNKLITN
jgi:hypothetical protein